MWRGPAPTFQRRAIRIRIAPKVEERPAKESSLRAEYPVCPVTKYV